jgi:GNAT superfamily N-acetyltransferase
LSLVRYADRPDLRAIRWETLARATFPEFAHHSPIGTSYWGRLYDEFPEFQLGLVDGDELVAELHSVPVAWNGDKEVLPYGWEDVFPRAFDSGRSPDVLCALAISVRPDRQGAGLSRVMLNALRDATREAGLRQAIAPVRPTLKSSYPLTPIEEYMTWRHEDGRHFDPWIRIHERLGGRIVAPAPRSMTIEAPVREWEDWTQMLFPADGEYVFPGGLATLVVRDGIGRHVEPNIWLAHDV